MYIAPIQNLGFAGKIGISSRALNSNHFSKLQGAYHCDTVSFTRGKTHLQDNKEIPKNIKEYLGDNVKYLDEAKAILNNAIFEFETEDGIFTGTLREYFEDSIVNERPVPGYEIYHGTLKEAKNAILDANKLDYTKTTRIKCGPGTYFSGGMGDIFSYGGCCLCAKYAGDKTKIPVFKDSFYTSVEDNNEIVPTLRNKLGANSNAEAEKLLKVVAHDILVEDMGIDMLYAPCGHASGCFVVLNDDCVEFTE